mmetsp:Transcript_6310/g.15639  ORF Transcript_6310/g.15639 Transcript_6310/m.15639 type:complete len:1092 (-) Transcript_6310:314-3589(-)|eukprot:CAMPEP_0197190478 /NCGR_PEP_ID=MMETSP1423-20130617/21719_1 /TAXON_ID=476441 /ORGANISM="Pseudo-nitzschia heimii, Strain UNC1101" /LENGTH=1091 /DNA_ID=CAMNT_0042642865 /DNA_START=93 /DNA_END=3368 /DNA_ORIENTATION=+
MTSLRIRPEPGYHDFPDSSFESMGSGHVSPTVNSAKLTVDTSSDTSQWNSSNQMQIDELMYLRRRVKTHEKREEQLNNDLIQIQEKLKFFKKSAALWKYAMKRDLRPGSHYRMEIVLLKQELDKMHDDIRDREVTIENLVSRNHRSHSFLEDDSDDRQTYSSSILFDETVENLQMQDIERLLLEKSLYSEKLQKRDEEVHQLHRKPVNWEKERIDMLQKVAISDQKDKPTWKDLPVHFSQQIIEQKESLEISKLGMLAKNPFRIDERNSSSLVPLDAFQKEDCQSSICSTENSNDHCGSMKTSKRIVELQNELNKTKKERKSFQDKLEQSKTEANRLRRKLGKIEGECRENESGLPASHNEVMDLKKGLNDSLVELETAAAVITRQKRTIQDMKKQSNVEKMKYMELHHSFEVRTKNLQITKKNLRRNDAEIKELVLTIRSLEKQMVSKNNDLKNLRQTVILWENKYINLQNEMMNERSEINRSENSQSEVIDMPGKQHPQFLNSGKKEDEIFVEKTCCLTKQLQQGDEILFGKELENIRLKSSVERIQLEYISTEAKKTSADTKTQEEIVPMRTITPVRNKKSNTSEVSLCKSIPITNAEAIKGIPTSMETKIDGEMVLKSKERVDLITAAATDQRHEKDIIVKKFAHLVVRNRSLEQKCDAFKRKMKFYNDETVRLHDTLVRENCDIEPFQKYINFFLDINTYGDDNLSEPNNFELEKARTDSVNKFHRLLKACAVFDEKSNIFEKDLNQKDHELRQLRKSNESLLNTISSRIELFRAELKEMQDIIRRRYDLKTGLQGLRDEIKEMEEKNGSSKKEISGSLSCKLASGQIREFNTKTGEHVEDITLNSDLKEKAFNNIERVDELTSEIKKLKQMLSDDLIKTGSCPCQKIQLDRGKYSENETLITYERKIAALSMNKDATIDALKMDFNTLRSRSREEVASLTNELNKLRALNNDLKRRYTPEIMQQKDRRILILEQTLHAQEVTADSLRCELGRVQLAIKNVSEQRMKDLDQLPRELLESQSTRIHDHRERAQSKAELDGCKIEHKKEIGKVNKQLSLSSIVREPQLNTMMQEAKGITNSSRLSTLN